MAAPPVFAICQQLIESLRNLTEPSAKPKLAPPGWKLAAEATYASGPLSRQQKSGILLNGLIG